MTTSHPHIAFIGAGNMASAIAQGLHAQGGYALSVTDTYAPALSKWEAQFQATELSFDADAFVLAVKPQQFAEAALSLAHKIKPTALVVSVMAGVTLDTITRALGGHAAIVRTMPNTPARIGQGITALFATPACTTAHTQLAQAVMCSIGQTVWLSQESQIDAVTAVSGSGPAYVFYIAQALTQAGIALGLSPEVAKQLSLVTLQGSSALALATGEDLDTLREQVTSKGGTTAAALDVFKAMHLDQTLHAAVDAAHKRAQELARAS